MLFINQEEFYLLVGSLALDGMIEDGRDGSVLKHRPERALKHTHSSMHPVYLG